MNVEGWGVCFDTAGERGACRASERDYHHLCCVHSASTSTLLPDRLKTVKGESTNTVSPVERETGGERGGERERERKARRAECCHHSLSLLSSTAQNHIKGKVVRRPPEAVKRSHTTSTSAARERVLFLPWPSRALARALVLIDFKGRVGTQTSLCRETASCWGGWSLSGALAKR